jgi:hypothetical protein
MKKIIPVNVLFIFLGSEGVEEIKRHLFFANVDWNVSCMESSLVNNFVLE